MAIFLRLMAFKKKYTLLPRSKGIDMKTHSTDRFINRLGSTNSEISQNVVSPS